MGEQTSGTLLEPLSVRRQTN